MITFARQFVALALLLGAHAWAHGACGAERYFSPEDPDQRRPLRVPHAEFQNTLARANAGDPVQLRNLGVYYETGYLVTKCLETATQWYAKAAAAGDKKAEAWIARSNAFARMREGSPCAGSSCPPVPGTSTAIELLANSRGHFIVPVTINGVTVNGVVDTGATLVAINSSLARQMRITYENGTPIRIRTANGVKAGYMVTLPAIAVGGLTFEQVPASVSDSDFPLLVGMSVLQRLKVSVDGGRMVISRP